VLGKTVALKVAPLSGILLLPGFYAEFRGALETARALSHANILQIHDFKLLETIACGIVEYVDGESLEHRMLKAGAPLELRLIKDLACQIAEALAHAHSRGIVHCRLTPSSVLIARSDDRVFVTGFGMPNVGSGPEAAAVRALFMDATYESPEQSIGELPSPQSDQYALGAVLYEMLTGRPPFRGKTAYTVLKQHCEAAPLPVSALRPDCPPAIEATVMRLLRKHPHERFLATRELLMDMHDWPLPEPAGSRDRISASSLETRAARTALASFERSLHEEPLLLVHFYRRLCADPSFAQLFERTNFDRQIDMLRKGVRHLLEYGLGDENTRRELERIATQHKNLAMSERQLHGFVDVLVTLLLEYDPHATDPAERELLRRDWHNTIELGLTPFLEIARACVSSVPVAAQ
jgi:serine/threonine protein kinase